MLFFSWLKFSPDGATNEHVEEHKSDKGEQRILQLKI